MPVRHAQVTVLRPGYGGSASQHHVPTVGGELAGDQRPDAAGGACDECGFHGPDMIRKPRGKGNGVLLHPAARGVIQICWSANGANKKVIEFRE